MVTLLRPVDPPTFPVPDPERVSRIPFWLLVVVLDVGEDMVVVMMDAGRVEVLGR